jgi:hypothetical protein
VGGPPRPGRSASARIRATPRRSNRFRPLARDAASR